MDIRTVDFSALEPQHGDDEVPVLSFILMLIYLIPSILCINMDPMALMKLPYTNEYPIC